MSRMIFLPKCYEMFRVGQWGNGRILNLNREKATSSSLSIFAFFTHKHRHKHACFILYVFVSQWWML